MAQPGPSSGQRPSDIPEPVRDLIPSSTIPDPEELLEEEHEKNPVRKVGRKLKRAFNPSSSQQPSIRILRDPATGTKVAVPQEVAEQLPPSLDEQLSTGGEQAGKTSTEYAEHFAAQARAHPDNASVTSGFGGKIKSFFGGGGGKTKDESGSVRGKLPKGHDSAETINPEEYDADTVDFLDVVDPEVSTLSTLTNVQNSLFVPSLGGLINRRATYRLSSRPGEARTIQKLKTLLHPPPSDENVDEKGPGKDKHASDEIDESPERPELARGDTITSTLSESRYAVLPHGENLQGWTHEEKEELNDMVRHMLHSRRARFKRSLKGFGQYVRRPLGLFITVYATLITLFGAAWVLFLIGWISLGAKRDYVINIVDNVLVALFAVIGDGLAPFRAVDTYHMVFIAYYHRKTWKRRQRLGLPNLADPNDLPEQRKEDVVPMNYDIESLMAKRRIPRRLAGIIAPRLPKRLARRMVTRGSQADPSYEYTVLTEKEQATLEHHERKFSKSHTFYKPHETETHYAFPQRLLIAVVLLLDMHSLLQITLGSCTWGIPYKSRPFALTTVVLCCSITCNVMGGILISVGDHKTRKKDVIERMMRQELTSEAIDKMEDKWMKEAEKQGELDRSVRKKYQHQREEAENEEIKRAWMKVPSLPKRLLGKQKEDNRQVSLPQQAKSTGQQRRSPSHSQARLSGTGRSGRKEGSFSPTSGDPRGRLSTVKEDRARSKARMASQSQSRAQQHAARIKAQAEAHEAGETQAGANDENAELEQTQTYRGEHLKPPEKESTGDKIMRFVRRADLDRS